MESNERSMSYSYIVMQASAVFSKHIFPQNYKNIGIAGKTCFEKDPSSPNIKVCSDLKRLLPNQLSGFIQAKEKNKCKAVSLVGRPKLLLEGLFIRPSRAAQIQMYADDTNGSWQNVPARASSHGI